MRNEKWLIFFFIYRNRRLVTNSQIWLQMQLSSNMDLGNNVIVWSRYVGVVRGRNRYYNYVKKVENKHETILLLDIKRYYKSNKISNT